MVDFAKWEHHHKHSKWAEEADQLEWSTSQVGKSPFMASQMDDEVADLFVEMQSESESDAAFPEVTGETVPERIDRNLREATEEIDRSESRRDEMNAGVQAEIERRSLLLGDEYPFVRSMGSLDFRGASTPGRNAYMNCLRTSLIPSAADREAFEGLVAKALEAYLGKGRATVQLFGWQARPEDDRPRRIKTMIEDLSKASGEWQWKPDEGFPDNPSSKLVKDLGLDVIAWLPMPDNRLGQLFLLAQCATGRTDWDEKLNDVSWERMESWIRPLPKGWTIRCFAIPFHLPNEKHWKTVSGQGGLFLDRTRLTLLLKESP
jgi:hypothetical protein